VSRHAAGRDGPLADRLRAAPSVRAVVGLGFSAGTLERVHAVPFDAVALAMGDWWL